MKDVVHISGRESWAIVWNLYTCIATSVRDWGDIGYATPTLHTLCRNKRVGGTSRTRLAVRHTPRSRNTRSEHTEWQGWVLQQDENEMRNKRETIFLARTSRTHEGTALPEIATTELDAVVGSAFCRECTFWIMNHEQITVTCVCPAPTPLAFPVRAFCINCLSLNS